ncbi:MAG: TetM/TetW/TetO/TetS family tetracycline resistance ribosomal protection protein [Eubacterium sp.]|nr:TetM/TetW/TetO/TetS family tetracycline resistance ribosomal protection protein [Eubacterium sp.]
MTTPRLTIGLTAHVDAGKTTLSEGLLYAAGMLRKTGRVDHGDAFLDTYDLEKKRGITIFSKQAVLPWCVLLDTPGHVDFSPEMERILRVLDYAILVISATDGIQGHTATLWRLLAEYEVPVFIFVNKTDQIVFGSADDGSSQELSINQDTGMTSVLQEDDRNSILSELIAAFGDGVIDFTDTSSENWCESIAMTDEDLMENYLESGEISDDDIRDGILNRRIFPCYFGSALKTEGVDEFYQGIQRFTEELWADEIFDTDNSLASTNDDKQKNMSDSAMNSGDFGAVVYKISRDDKGTRLTHIRVTRGVIKPKQTLNTDNNNTEKADQLRLYNGNKYELLDEAVPGMICALTGLVNTRPGQGLGMENDVVPPVLQPVLTYRLILPSEVSVVSFLPKLMELNEEMPELHISAEKPGNNHSSVDNETGTEQSGIHVRVMGQVQTEILHEVILERFGVDVSFGQAQIVYKETVTKPVEGIGHYEPLKHYAEAHVAIEPGEPGSGVVVGSSVSEDELALNWQRLILTHLTEREHKGVLIGAGLDDVRMTVVGGRAHLKHTEGGDFRQATYRAIRMGLMQAECRLLEPYYDFVLTVPQENVGRAMTDIERMHGTFSLGDSQSMGTSVVDSENGNSTMGGNYGIVSVLTGQAPVATMQDYARELAAYTSGTGELSLSLHGYLPCHNADEIIAASGYDPETDEENPTGSVFCEHGAGFYVPWNEVAARAHVQTNWHPENSSSEKEKEMTDAEMREAAKLHQMDLALGVEEIDAIIDRVGNANKRSETKSRRRVMGKQLRQAKAAKGPSKPRKTNEKLGDYLLVDGYNIIHAWDELKNLARDDMEQARGRLQDILCNYQGYRGGDVILVFDAYRVASHPTETFDYHNIHVVYTKTAETADQYIERFSSERADRYHVTVATSDGLEQIIIRGAGAHLMSARDLEEDVRRVSEQYN